MFLCLSLSQTRASRSVLCVSQVAQANRCIPERTLAVAFLEGILNFLTATYSFQSRNQVIVLTMLTCLWLPRRLIPCTSAYAPEPRSTAVPSTMSVICSIPIDSRTTRHTSVNVIATNVRIMILSLLIKRFIIF